MTSASNTSNHIPNGSTHRSKRTLSDHANTFHPMVKISEGSEDDNDHPDQISTSASEASSQNSTNSEPPLLDFISTACMASTWFTSCFPCAVVDINNCDDRVMEKLDRTNAMSVMYGAVAAPIPNSFELSPGEKVEGGDPHPYSLEEVGNLIDEEDEKPIIGLMELRMESDAPPSSPGAEKVIVGSEEVLVILPESELDQTPATSKRKRFHMNLMPKRHSSGGKLFGRKKQ
jgi:hypothetical protein